MSDLFEGLIGPLLAVEGGYSNHPADTGGETNFGVTIAVARENGYAGPMKAMTRDQAVAIYRRRYWTGPGFDKVAAVSARVAAELFDTGVNMGPEPAGVFLQRTLNVLNRQAADFADVKVDGAVGPGTVAALASFIARRGAAGEAALLKGMNALQGARYIQLAELRPANEAFALGWLAHRVGLAA